MENIFEILKSSLLLHFRDKGGGTLFSYKQLMASLYGVYPEADGTVDRRLTLAESLSLRPLRLCSAAPTTYSAVCSGPPQASLCSSTSRSHCLSLTPMPFFSKFLLSVPPPPY